MRTITIHALDDSKIARKFLQEGFAELNRNNTQGIYVNIKTFADPVDFMEALTPDVDLALLDINLQDETINGFDVSEAVLESFKKMIRFMVSASIEFAEEYVSYISKVGLKASEILYRFLMIEKDLDKNRLELMSGQEYYAHAARA